MGGLARSMQSGSLKPLRKIADPGNLSAKYDPLAKKLLKPKPEAPKPPPPPPPPFGPAPGDTGKGLRPAKTGASASLRRRYAAAATFDDATGATGSLG